MFKFFKKRKEEKQKVYEEKIKLDKLRERSMKEYEPIYHIDMNLVEYCIKNKELLGE